MQGEGYLVSGQHGDDVVIGLFDRNGRRLDTETIPMETLRPGAEDPGKRGRHEAREEDI